MYIPLNLYCLLLPGWPMTVFMFYEHLVCSNCLTSRCSSEKSSSSIINFLHWHLSNNNGWLWEAFFHTEGNTKTKGLIHNYYKVWKHLLKLKKEIQCIKSRGCKLLNRMMCTFIILLKYLYIYKKKNSTILQKLILTCFPEDKISTIYLVRPKKFTHPALCWLLEHQ